MPSPMLAPWLLAAALGAGEDEVLIYRCTDASGHDTYQDAKCPENSFQHIIRMQRPSETPPPPPPKPAAAPAASAAVANPAPAGPAAEAGTPATAAPSASAEGGEAGSVPPTRGFSLPPWETEESLKPPPPSGPQVRRIASGDVPPLPALWRCRGLDRKAYISETDKPPPKCIPLAELGIQLDALPKEMRSGCQNVHDACDPLSPFEVCGHLRAQLANGAVAGEEAAGLESVIETRCPVP